MNIGEHSARSDSSTNSRNSSVGSALAKIYNNDIVEFKTPNSLAPRRKKKKKVMDEETYVHVSIIILSIVRKCGFIYK